MLTIPELLEQIDKYCRLTGRAESGVGKEVMNDTKIIDRLREGSDCVTGTILKFEKWLHKNMPKENPISTRKRRQAVNGSDSECKANI
jgi:hypothetical protein